MRRVQTSDRIPTPQVVVRIVQADDAEMTERRAQLGRLLAELLWPSGHAGPDAAGVPR